MAISNERYSQSRIELLKNYLDDMAAKGQAKYYKIYVDSFEVVPKTNEQKEFYDYEKYVDENTKTVKFIIFDSGLSPRNNQYVFSMHSEGKMETGLNGFNGLGEIETIVQEKLAQRDREYEMARLKDELQKTKEQLDEAEEYADTLVKELEELKSKKFHLGNFNVGELASVALEGMIRRNPQFLTKIPGGETLAGIIEQDNIEKQQAVSDNTQETQVSFQKKTSGADLKPEHLRYIPLLQQLDSAFNTAELEIVMSIIQRLAEEPHNLKTVSELLNIQNS